MDAPECKIRLVGKERTAVGAGPCDRARCGCRGRQGHVEASCAVIYVIQGGPAFCGFIGVDPVMKLRGVAEISRVRRQERTDAGRKQFFTESPENGHCARIRGS